MSQPRDHTVVNDTTQSYEVKAGARLLLTMGDVFLLNRPGDMIVLGRAGRIVYEDGHWIIQETGNGHDAPTP